MQAAESDDAKALKDRLWGLSRELDQRRRSEYRWVMRTEMWDHVRRTLGPTDPYAFFWQWAGMVSAEDTILGLQIEVRDDAEGIQLVRKTD